MALRASKIGKPIKNGVAKVPVVMQLEALECGAASLTMILAYYGKWIPLEQVRVDCGVSRDGSNAKNVLKAARNYGLESKGYRLETEAFATNVTFPCIVHWEFNHFIVVKGYKNGKFYVNDPARGNVILPYEQFDEGFTGICLMFSPTESFEPSGKPKSILGFVKKRMNGSQTALAFLVLITVISAILSILEPGFSRVFLDYLLVDDNSPLIKPFFILFAIYIFINIIVGFISSIYSMRIDGKLAVTGNASYMWKVLTLPLRFFTQRMAGDIQQRKTTNASIASNLVNTFAPLAINIVMMIFYLIIMARYSIILTLIGLGSIIINLLVGKIISAKRVNVTRVLMRDEGKLYGTTVAGIKMIETIKSAGAENGFFKKWSGYRASVNNGEVVYARIDSYLGIIPSIVTSLTSAIIVIYGTYMIICGDFTMGMMLAFQGFLVSFTTPATELITTSQTLMEMRTEMERIEDVMEYESDFLSDSVGKNEDEEDSDANSSSEEYRKLTGNIEIKDVTFGYSPLGEPTVSGFSTTVKPGQSIAIVGASGSGKSTMSKLISGLYKPWSGEILFDGMAIEEINRRVFTGSLAVVDQDITIFDDTVANNIRMWDSSIEDFEVIMASRDASIHDVIIQKPDGYQHKVAEGGKDFSGGQKQRMEIARVLAQDPTIIILDEATSALDAQTEYEIVNAIKDRGITSIVIAHRLSTIRDCDEIIVLDRGVIVERGTHDELYALNGYYTQLISNE